VTYAEGAGNGAHEMFLEVRLEKVPLTIKGYGALEEELRQRQQVERPRIIQAISDARALGDLSENAEYHAAKESQALNEGRILELESLISRAEVIDVTKLSGDRIKFGATVKLVDEDTDEEKIYQIVGEPESDVRSGLVSVSSPIARALMGRTVGDTVEVTTPGGGKSYEVVDVRFS
jgi:transcription elongation factor GreA